MKEEIEDLIEVSRLYGDDVYGESGKRDECIEPCGSKKRVLQNMHRVEAVVTIFEVVQVTTQLRMDVVQEEPLKIPAKE